MSFGGIGGPKDVSLSGSSSGTEFTDGDSITTASLGTLLIGTTDVSGTARAVITDDDGHFQIDILSSALPSGAATQTTLASILTDTNTIAGVDFSTETTLGLMSAKLPATLGQKVMAASMAVVIASDQSAVPITAASLPLPAGASTAALQTTGNAILTTIDVDTGIISAAVVAGQMQTDIVAALPTGANTIGAVTQASGPWEINGSVGHDGVSSDNPFIGGGVATSIGSDISTTDGPTAVAAADVVQTLHSIQGYAQVQNWAYISTGILLTDLDQVFDGTPSTANSADINGQGFRRFSYSVEVTSAGSPTRIQWILQAKDSSGNYSSVVSGPWGNFSYEDVFLSTTRNLVFQGEVPSSTFRIRIECTSVSGGNTFTTDDSEIELIT